MREIVSPLSGIRSPFGPVTSLLAMYAVLGFKPQLAFDFDDERYFTGSRKSTFSDAITHSASSNATMVDSDGLLKWRPHNLALNSATPATQPITVVSGADYTVECTGVSIALSGAGTGTVTEGSSVTITASTTTLTLTVTGSTGTMWAYRSDLGGMVNNPDRGDSYVPTTSSAVYLPRRGHHVYNGSAWVNEGLLHESEARTNLLHTTDALVTQSLTVTAVPHTLHFTGTGTVTLSGASTAGPLVGTGTGENNRVSLTFTPTAASLTLTVSGTVTNAQLEVGSTPSSYIPNLAASGSVTRAAETLTIPAANLPWPTPVYVTGEELVTNGTFDTDTDWTLDAGATISGGTLNNTTDTAVFATQAGVGSSGKIYQVSYDVTARTSGSVSVGVGSVSGKARSAVGSYVDYIVATSSDGAFVTSRFGSAFVGSIDNISVKEINPLAVSIQMQGQMTYADEGVQEQLRFVQWQTNSTNYIYLDLFTNLSKTGAFFARQSQAATADFSASADDAYSPGVLVPFNIASRHGSTFINGAVDGVALTADLTPVALPDLSATDLNLGYDYMGTIKLFRIWANDLADAGIATASFGGNYLATEASDRLDAENGDNLITEN